ncbi:MAG: hypothetical protein ACR2RF_24440, partial [Geminicoccaceae bacterium]
IHPSHASTPAQAAEQRPPAEVSPLAQHGVCPASQASPALLSSARAHVAATVPSPQSLQDHDLRPALGSFEQIYQGGDMLMLGTSKKNPVIGPINLESTVAYAQQLREGMIDWTSGKEWEKKFFSSRGAKARLDEWQQKFADGRSVINAIERSGRRGSGRACLNGFVYMFNGAPIGIMTVSTFPTYVYINGIVASPATSGAGGVLIEAAVRWSERSGCSGNVSLCTLSETVSEVYLRYGFENSGFRKEPVAGKMDLIPTTSDAWQKTDDGWTLKAKIGKAYAVSGIA